MMESDEISIKNPDYTLNPRHITNVCRDMKLPLHIAESYAKLGVETLYDWQYDCIHKSGVLTNENIVYCAPTSGGKTLISELMILRSTISYKKRAIFILPFVSLVLEKAAYFKKILRSYIRSLGRDRRFHIKAYHSDSNVNQIQVSDMIIVCTIEKANQLINTLIAREVSSSIGCVIVDEMHTLGDSFNGYLLEILVSKLKYLVKKSHDQYIKFQASQQNNVQGSQLLRAPESIGIQLGAMSATVGNINALASWFSAQLYVSTFRPVPLRECVVVGEDVLDTQGKVLHRLSLGSSAKSKPSPVELINRVIIQLCMDGIKNGQQILIFCPTKQMCQQTCELILKQLVPLSRKIFTHPSISWTEEQLLFRRQQAYQELGNSEDDLLAKVTAKDPAASASTIASQLQIYIQSGLGFHHSGLNSKQRSLIENAFRSGEISILAATSTLAAGVNLPAGRVIIRSLLMGRDELNVTNYKQMTGRAGRAGQCVNDCGESFLLAAPSDLTKALKLVNQPLPDVNSQMNPRLDGGRGLMKAILEMHSLNICRTLADTLEYVKGTLLYQESTSSTPSYSSSNSFDHGMLDTVLNAFNFLLLANALDIPSLTPPPPPVSTKPPAKVSSSTVQSLIPTIVKEVPSTPCLTPGNLSEFQDRQLIITRFGRAIVQSSMNPDEAIIVYKDLLQAQNGINLESNLHLIYLLTPVENSFTPDFSEMLKWYERGKQATKARDPKDEFVGQSMGLEEAYGYLNNWSHKPPTHDDITTCVEKVRNMSLRTWEDHKDTKNKLYYECLVRCKRVWVARVADKILQKGDTPLHTIASSLHVSPFDLENLRRSVNMMASRIQRFCAEVGWSALERLINSFKSTVLNDDILADCRELMQLEGVNQSLAEKFALQGLKTASDLLLYTPDALATFLQQQRSLTVNTNSSNSTTSMPASISATMNSSSSSALIIASDAAQSNSNSVVSGERTLEDICRDEKVFRSLKALMGIVLESARKFIQNQKEGVEKKVIETLSKDQPVTDTQPDREVLLDEIKPESNLVIELNSDSESVIASEDDNNDDNDDKEMDEDDNDDVRSTDSGYWSSEDALNQALARRELILEETSMTFNRVLQSPIKTIIQGTRPYFNNTSTTTVVQPKLEPSPRKQVSRKSDSQQQESQTSVLSLFDQVTGRKGSSKLTEFQYEISSESQNDMELDSNILKAIEPTTYLQPISNSTSSHAHDQVNNNDTNITAASKASGRTGNFSWKLQETTDFPYEFDDEYDEEEEEEDEGDYDHAPTPPTKVRRLQPVNEVNENLDSNLSTSEQLLDLRILSANSKATTQELDVNMKRKVEFHNNPQDPVDDRNKHIKTVLAINSSQNTSSNSNTQSEPSQDMVAERVTTEPFLPITATAAVRRERRASITPSPYLTPFTASKLLDTPDHYLYLPQVHIGNNFSTSNARRESRMSTTSEAEEQVDVNTPLFSIDALSPTANLQAFGSGHLGKTGNCRKFLQKLQHCRCISFELVFRRIPSASLRDRDKWASRISWFCGEDSSSYRGGVCSNVSLHQKPTSTWPARPTSSKATRTGMRDPHVLSGVSFNFGDNYGYYLPLPCSLPILFDSADDAQTTSAEMNASAKLQSLPLKCHWLISRFVGFESIFHRTPYLRIRSRGDDEVPAPVSLVRNPLLELNKYWVRVARQALLIEWKKGQCVEWRLLNEVMGKQGVTKVSTDMATKLSALRERDIIVNGSLEDPCIAVTILTHATGIYDMKKAEPSFVTSLAYPSELHYGVISGAAADAAAASVDPYNSRSCRLACYRATATMRAMARLTTSLMNYGSLELYRNIEMPLIFTTADMEFHGIGVDSAFFTDLKSNLEDRLKIIEYYFKYTQGSDFNVSSGKDKKKLLNNLLGSYRNFLNQTLRNMRIYDFDESSERYMSYMKCLEDAPKRLEKHPLVLLRKEHAFFLRSVLPFCEEIIGLRKFGGRVRATIDTIGTETGRLIVSDPPLQHAPKKVFYCHTADRPSLHQEVLSLALEKLTSINLTSVATVCEQLNQSIAYGEKTCNVRVSVRSPTGATIGKVLRISNKSISDTPDGDENLFATVSSQINRWPSLADIWRRAGHVYSEDEASRIRQVIVQFPDTHKIYAYPADKVYRMDAPITPNTAELEIISKAQLEGIWDCNKTYSIGDSCCLLSESAIKAKKAAALISGDDSSIPLQNFRSGFVASEGYVLLSADYCQMELRLLANFSEDPNLCQAFHGQQDVFRVLAARWKDKDPADITTREREIIKQLCYANIYGSGARAIAEQAEIEVEEASHMMEDFKKSYPGIPAFIASIKESCQEKGYITTLLGRRRTIPLIRSENRQEQAKGQRQAVNSMCQGSAADLVKLAMINISYRLSLLTRADSDIKPGSSILSSPSDSNEPFSPSTVNDLKAASGVQCRKIRRFPGGGLYSVMDEVRLVLQVHDELVYEVRKDLLPAVCKIVRECMEGAVSLRVPLQVKISTGPAWGKLNVLTEESPDASTTSRKPVARAIFGKNDDD